MPPTTDLLCHPPDNNNDLPEMTADCAIFPTTTTPHKRLSSSSGNCTQLSSRRPTNDFVRQQSEIVQRCALELGPAFQYWNAVGPTLFDFAQQVIHINRVALAHLLLGCNVLALQALLLTKTLIAQSAIALGRLAWSAWDSKQGRRLRKKLEFEFFVLILGCGNGFACMVFWPGWMLVGLVYLACLVWNWAG